MFESMAVAKLETEFKYWNLDIPSLYFLGANNRSTYLRKKKKNQSTRFINNEYSHFVCPVSMENINTDIHELERGMELTKRESILRKDSRDYPPLLKDFLSGAEDVFKKLISDVKTAQVS